MDRNVEKMSKAYANFTDSLTAYLLAAEISGGQDKELTDKALAKVKEHYETFRNACDNADDEVQTAKKKLLTGHGSSVNESVLPSTDDVTIVDDDGIAYPNPEYLARMYHSPPRDQLVYENRPIQPPDNYNGCLEAETTAAKKLADAAVEVGPPGETAGCSCSGEN